MEITVMMKIILIIVIISLGVDGAKPKTPITTTAADTKSSIMPQMNANKRPKHPVQLYGRYITCFKSHCWEISSGTSNSMKANFPGVLMPICGLLPKIKSPSHARRMVAASGEYITAHAKQQKLNSHLSLYKCNGDKDADLKAKFRASKFTRDLDKLVDNIRKTYRSSSAKLSDIMRRFTDEDSFFGSLCMGGGVYQTDPVLIAVRAHYRGKCESGGYARRFQLLPWSKTPAEVNQWMVHYGYDGDKALKTSALADIVNKLHAPKFSSSALHAYIDNTALHKYPYPFASDAELGALKKKRRDSYDESAAKIAKKKPKITSGGVKIPQLVIVA